MPFMPMAVKMALCDHCGRVRVECDGTEECDCGSEDATRMDTTDTQALRDAERIISTIAYYRKQRERDGR